jgi:hypothetical protein
MSAGGAVKRRFLVVYDYGQGGAWAFLLARSASEIERKFPELKVVKRRPGWMSKGYGEQLEKDVFDIDSPRGFLASILAQRPGRQEASRS